MAVVAVEALPAKAPVNVVADTEVNPDNEVEVAPKEIEVEPIVTLLFVKALFGIPVKLVPVSVGVVDHAGVPDTLVNTPEPIPSLFAAPAVPPIIKSPDVVIGLANPELAETVVTLVINPLALVVITGINDELQYVPRSALTVANVNAADSFELA